MQSPGRCYVRNVYTGYRFCGISWKGRYQSRLVDGARYPFARCRYIESQSRTGGAGRHVECLQVVKGNAMPSGAVDPSLTLCAAYRSLTETDDEWRSRYRALVAQAMGNTEIDPIRTNFEQQRALGAGRLQRAIEAQLGPRVTVRAAHRAKLEKAL